MLCSACLNNPQSLNRYAYSLNNPLRFVDPTGMQPSQTPEQDRPKEVYAGTCNDFSSTCKYEVPPEPTALGVSEQASGSEQAPATPSAVAPHEPTRRTDLVLVPSGTGQAEPTYVGPGKGWRLDWTLKELHGERPEYASPNYKIELFERLVTEKEYRSGGFVTNQNRFTDIFTPERRDLVQFYKVDQKQVQFWFTGSQGEVVKTWYILVSVSTSELTYKAYKGP